jgi:hypothetical protein
LTTVTLATMLFHDDDIVVLNDLLGDALGREVRFWFDTSIG